MPSERSIFPATNRQAQPPSDPPHRVQFPPQLCELYARSCLFGSESLVCVRSYQSAFFKVKRKAAKPLFVAKTWRSVCHLCQAYDYVGCG
jgi:hypothetical protein